jgi:hypothetical protein
MTRPKRPRGLPRPVECSPVPAFSRDVRRWDAVSYAAIEVGVKYQAICIAIKGKTKSAGVFWRDAKGEAK